MTPTDPPHGPYGPAEFHGRAGPYGPYTSHGPGGRRAPYTPDERDGTGARGVGRAAGSTLPRRGIVMHDAGRARTTRHGRRWPDGALVEQVLAAVIKDSERMGELLDVLSRGRLWVPLPDDGTPVTDGSAIRLPTVVYLSAEFVPAFTSAELLVTCTQGGAVDADYIPEPRSSGAGRRHDPEPGWSRAGRHQDPEPGWSRAGRHHVGWMAGRAPGTTSGSRRSVPHIVVPAAELARRLPAGLGIAVNPGAQASVPVYPEGVTYLAAAEWEAGDVRIRLSRPPVEPEGLLREVAAGLHLILAARQASGAWLSVSGEGEGLIISVTLDDPGDEASQAAVLAAVEHAAGAAGPAARFPIDVTFPGEREPDDVDRWIAEHATPFHLR